MDQGEIVELAPPGEFFSGNPKEARDTQTVFEPDFTTLDTEVGCGSSRLDEGCPAE